MGRFQDRLLRAIFAAAVLASWPAVSIAAGCELQVGDRVVLSADTADPDVFVWDSRSRLIEYSAGNWGSTKDIFGHTLLVDPGTQALVMACRPGEAHPKYEPTDEDVLGIRIVTGRHRNLWGWVVSNDVHALR